MTNLQTFWVKVFPCSISQVPMVPQVSEVANPSQTFQIQRAITFLVGREDNMGLGACEYK